MFDQINEEKSKYETGMIIGFVLVGIGAIVAMTLGSGLGPGAFFIAAIPLLAGGVYARYNQNKLKELSNNFKEKYVTEELKKVFPNSTYAYNEGFTEAEVTSSGLLKNEDRYKSEDMIRGQYEGVTFSCCDVEQKDVRRSGKHTRVVTVFQGRFYEFDFPKSFKHDLLLLQPYNYRPFSGLKKVKTESIDFNSELKIYAEDEHEAFYILTPDFMEKLIYFDQKYMDKISFSFKENRLYIAIDTRKDYFDIKAFKPLNKSIFNEYQDELNDIKALIKILKLDQSIFK